MHLACASMSPDDFTDAGLFNVLKNLISIPPRTAGDIDGFANSTFRTAADLHQRLDDLVTDPATRNAMAEPMHRSVIANDTYDVLAARILKSFAFLQSSAS
jgi:hypothetical protein